MIHISYTGYAIYIDIVEKVTKRSQERAEYCEK